LINRMLQRRPAARITLEGISRHAWLAGPESNAAALAAAAAAAPASAAARGPSVPTMAPESPRLDQPSKKLRGLDKLAAGMSSLRMGGSFRSSTSSDAASPTASPRGADGSTPSPRSVKWPRWLALKPGADTNKGA
jgi:hypothetical protein